MIRWADGDGEQSILKTVIGVAHQAIAGLRGTLFDRRDGRISVGAVLASRGVAALVAVCAGEFIADNLRSIGVTIAVLDYGESVDEAGLRAPAGLPASSHGLLSESVMRAIFLRMG